MTDNTFSTTSVQFSSKATPPRRIASHCSRGDGIASAGMSKELERASATSAGRLSTERHAYKVAGFSLFALSFQTLGIIYSDIGTSPLYVLNGIWPASGDVPPKEDVIGGISAIIWALTILPLAKYVFIALQFGTSEGEGGSFALFHGMYPPAHRDLEVERTLTGDFDPKRSKPSSSSSSGFLRAIKHPLLVLALFGTSLTMADGIMTPAVSVTSAVGGIAIAKPSVSSDTVPISIAFLVVLFLMQRFGTGKLAFMFAPITFIWFGLLAICGIINITKYPGIFRAFDPSRAVMLFVRTGNYDYLAGILLAVTGCEAMFANLGQFNKPSIQLSFTAYVYPSLLLAYLGQGARLIVDGEDVLPNLFYKTIPGATNGPLYWIFFVFAILASLIASQALITATFSLVQQVINLKSLAPLRMVYTSETVQGQIYVPFVNWVLMIVCIIMVACFKNLTNLSNAYGFAVATVMFTTSILIAFQIHYVKGKWWILSILYFLPFGFVEGLFWGASLKKVPEGAWVPLMIGCILCVFMCFWTWAKGLEDSFDSKNRQNLKAFISTSSTVDADYLQMRPRAESSPVAIKGDDSDAETPDNGTDTDPANASTLYYVSARTPVTSARSSMNPAVVEKAGLEPIEEKKEVARLPTCAVFHKLTPGSGVPHSFVGFVRQYPALPKICIFLSVQVLPIPRVTPEGRYEVRKVRSLPGFYGATYCLGFRDDFDVNIDEIVQQILRVEMQYNPGTFDQIKEEIQNYAQVSTHIVPHYHVISRSSTRVGPLAPTIAWMRSILVEEIYRPLSTMFPETANWTSSPDKIIHVGISAKI